MDCPDASIGAMDCTGNKNGDPEVPDECRVMVPDIGTDSGTEVCMGMPN